MVKDLSYLNSGTLRQKGFLMNPFRFGSAPPPTGEVLFDNASVVRIQDEASAPIESAAWTIGSAANRYLVAFSVGFAFSTTQAAASINHSGSGGASMTGLHTEFVPSGHSFTAARAYGLSNPASGSGTTYAQWTANQFIEGMHALAYSGVTAVGDIQTASINVEEPTATSTIMTVDLTTTDTTDMCVGFAWVKGDSGSRTISATTGNTSRGTGQLGGLDFFSFVSLEKARTGATTTLSADILAAGGAGIPYNYQAGIIGLVLKAA